ncbi:MAG: hypothetical protein JNJ65_01885 [Cyclobacteriaceae bacterium]|nr:hypothetical protein [Cyclobacteriaceae bacterium]
MESKLKELHEDLPRTRLYYKDYNLLFLSQVYIAEFCFGVYKHDSIINVVKRFSLDNLAKLFMGKLKRPFSSTGSIESDFVFVSDVYNRAVIEALNIVYRAFEKEKSITIYTDPRLRQSGGQDVNLFDGLTLKVLLVVIRDSFKILVAAFHHREDLMGIHKKYGVSLILLLLNLFDSILMVNISEAIFAKMKTSKIILMSDVHKVSRIMVLLAKSKQIYSFVVQHGATIGEEGYLPVIADKILVWGPASKAWFLSYGQPESKIEIVGCPRLDSERFEKNQYKPIKTLQKALIVLSDILVEKKYLEVVRDALATHSDIEVTIKLHPGGAVDYTFIPETIFKNSGISFKVLRFENIKDLLRNTDFVFVTNSTVGMEAIIYSKPLFQYKSNELLDYTMDYEAFNCSHIFSTSQEIKRLLDTPELVFSKVVNYSDFVSHYFFELDGNSAERIKKYIEAYS